jgi:hypothetical protein
MNTRYTPTAAHRVLGWRRMGPFSSFPEIQRLDRLPVS